MAGREKQYDFEERCTAYALEVRRFFRSLPKGVQNTEDGRQLLRASGSVGANYIEANDALGDKDFLLRLRIARKEARESRYWPQLVMTDTKGLDEQRQTLLNETTELVRILSAMIRNRQQTLAGEAD